MRKKITIAMFESVNTHHKLIIHSQLSSLLLFEDEDAVNYDNKIGVDDEAYNGTVLGGGNIMVHGK